MSVCTFFGHRDCYGLDSAVVQKAVAELIKAGVDTFYVGHQGQFDGMVLSCLKSLKKAYPHIKFAVVLAYMPTQTPEYDLYKDYSMFPEELDGTLPRFAIEKRNRWMIMQAQYCLCYIQHTWGGAYKFARLAKRRNLQVINLGIAKF